MHLSIKILRHISFFLIVCFVFCDDKVAKVVSNNKAKLKFSISILTIQSVLITIIVFIKRNRLLLH
jgi:hypothetical protein